jgi:dipeptidyl aminopeptidase/acylaminoacyl peptidase
LTDFNDEGLKPLTEQAYVPFSPEEIADRLVFNDPRMSPDGSAVVFEVRTASKKKEHGEQALWLSRNGAAAKPFTTGNFEDGSPRWSPDGSKILFISDRIERGKNRLFVIPVDGGEGQVLGELEGEFTNPQWSPDGTSIAVLRGDPETDEEKKQKEEKNDPIVADSDPKRQRIWIVDAESGAARQLTYGTRQVWAFSWSNDGSRIAFTTTNEPDINAVMEDADLWIVASGGGVPKKVAHLSAFAGYPVFVEGPDGPAIVVATNDHREDPSESVWIVPLDGGEPRNLLPGYPGVVEFMGPIQGTDRHVAVRMVEGTHAHAYELEIATGTLRNVTPPSMIEHGSILRGPSFSANRETVALGWSSATVSLELYVGETGNEPKAVTDFGKAFRGRLNPTEIVRWQSDGIEIEGILTFPHGYEEGKRYPLIVEIHGGPTWQWEDYAFLDWHDWGQQLASHGFAVLAPNPRGSSGRGSWFQKLLQDDIGGGESRDLITGAQAMVERGVADPDRLGIGGWSWGGYLTAITITQTDIFKAAVMGAGLSNLISDHGTDDIWSANLDYFPGMPYHHLDSYWEASAIRHITNCKTPTLILHGDSDARVHPTQGMEMYRALRSLNVPTEFVRYPREPHGIRERHHQIDLMKRLLAWFQKYLG